MNFITAFAKVAFGDFHNNGDQFDRTGSEPHTYGGGKARSNPSANPSFDPVGGSKKKPSKNVLGLNTTLGLLDKNAAQRDDTAIGVSAGLDKEYNGGDPVRDAATAKMQKEVYLRHIKAEKGKKCL